MKKNIYIVIMFHDFENFTTEYSVVSEHCWDPQPCYVAQTQHSAQVTLKRFSLSSAGIAGTSHHAQCHRRCLQTHQGMPDSWTASPHKGENTFGGLAAIKKKVSLEPGEQGYVEVPPVP